MLEKHRDRLIQTITDIKNNPDHHDQSDWHCGTSHCFAGFAEVRALMKRDRKENINQFLDEYFSESDRLNDVINAGYFGISELAWNTLVSASNTLEQLEFFVDILIANDGHIVIKQCNISLAKTTLRGADLTRANLSNADLTRADLTRANLTRANLTRANLTRANLTRADLTRANLTRANLIYADLTYADLTYADLSNANLSNADLIRADLSNTNLSNANLSNANLSNANLTDTDLTRAYLTGAYLS